MNYLKIKEGVDIFHILYFLLLLLITLLGVLFVVKGNLKVGFWLLSVAINLLALVPVSWLLFKGQCPITTLSTYFENLHDPQTTLPKDNYLIDYLKNHYKITMGQRIFSLIAMALTLAIVMFSFTICICVFWIFPFIETIQK